jgi:hypothetical protein
VLEREKSAKAAGEGLRLGGQDVAKRGHLGILLCDCHFVVVGKESDWKNLVLHVNVFPIAARLFFGGDPKIWWGVKVPSD